ncbi:hypothetical protein DSM3645_03143 [Blastopirellula marina DSM 3645]|uniref:Uncharacterized protein n=1 Tax=Blastopirellula marina DSM 3645 TaxID=314230 RepID=A3ZVU2_9BACT|nr:hypothetical protein DSM3645_03143 [Blastopirellula marina DSM 3645]
MPYKSMEFVEPVCLPSRGKLKYWKYVDPINVNKRSAYSSYDVRKFFRLNQFTTPPKRFEDKDTE